jgi:hypothetical protein
MPLTMISIVHDLNRYGFAGVDRRNDATDLGRRSAQG